MTVGVCDKPRKNVKTSQQFGAPSYPRRIPHLRCQVVQRQRFYRTKKVAKFPHMRKYIFVYTPINFLIYGNIFPYIHKYISLYTQQREARNIAPELYNYRRMNPEQRAKSACVNLRGNTNRQL
ncbi:hypothetical protein CS059_05995 [Porphyromonas gingivalis]|nr:hypothetical protein CS059_05995 [Porphyromonas gingivalis]